MLHARELPRHLDVDAGEMADRCVGGPLFLAPPIAGFDIELPVDRLIVGIDEPPDLPACHEVCRIGAADQPIAIAIGLDDSARRVTMTLDAAASHSISVSQPARAERVEMMGAIQFGRRSDPSACRVQVIAGNGADQPEQIAAGGIVRISRVPSIALAV